MENIKPHLRVGKFSFMKETFNSQGKTFKIMDLPEEYKDFKTIKLPYDKRWEEEQRALFFQEYWYLFFSNKSDGKLKHPEYLDFDKDQIPIAQPLLGEQPMTPEDIEDKLEVERLLKGLSSRQCVVIKLRMDGYSYKEISDKLGIKEGTVRSHLMRATKTIRKLM